MIARLLCLLGFHEWESANDPYSLEEYLICCECLKREEIEVMYAGGGSE